VADAVVRGHSAEGLLDGHTGSGGGIQAYGGRTGDDTKQEDQTSTIPMSTNEFADPQVKGDDVQAKVAYDQENVDQPMMRTARCDGLQSRRRHPFMSAGLRKGRCIGRAKRESSWPDPAHRYFLLRQLRVHGPGCIGPLKVLEEALASAAEEPMTAHSNAPVSSSAKLKVETEKVSYAEKKAHLDKLLDTFHTAFLISHAHNDPENHFHARPMGLLGHDDNGDLWFATDVDSTKIDEINADPTVLVTLQDGGRFVAVTGQAAVVHDRNKLDELWNPHMKVWFPKGPDDPNLALLRVDAREASFWDSSGSRGLKYLFQAAAALVTGTRPEGQNSEKDNATIKL